LRGYFYKNLPFRTSIFQRRYYLDFSAKSKYFLFDKKGIPLVIYNKSKVVFPVTVINYFMGLLDSNNLSKIDLINLNRYLDQNIDNENNFIFKHEFDEKNWGNKSIWYSNLPHAMLFSFLSRLTSNELSNFSYDLEFYFKSLFHNEIYKKGIFIEYPSTNSQPQNGQLFGLFAVVDAYNKKLISGKSLKFYIDESFILAKDQITPFGWTKYNNDRLASPFYHFLHINQYRVCKDFDLRFKKLYFTALLATIWYPLIIIYKITEKVINFVKS